MGKLLLRGGVYLALIGVVALLGAGLVANSLLPLDTSVPEQINVYVKDSVSLNPIPGATVNCYLSGELVSSAVTGEAGVASFMFLDGLHITFSVMAPAYESGSVTEVINSDLSKSVTVLLVKSGSVANYIDIYCLNNGGVRVKDVLVSSSTMSALSDDSGHVRVFTSSSGVDTITLSSSNSPSVLDWFVRVSVSFGDYSKTITAASGSTWVAYVEQGVLTQGSPGDNGSNVWVWLQGYIIPGVQNWVLVAGVLLLLIIRR